MLSQLISFECRSFFRQPIFWISSVAFLFLGLLFGRAGLGGPEVLVNSPFSLMMIMGLLSMGSIISVALFAGWSVLRDDEYRTKELLLTMPVNHWERVVSRFFGLFFSSLLSFGFIFPGLILALFMPESFERVGTVSIRAYLLPWFWVVLPNVFLISTIIFSVATFSRNQLLTYLSGVLLYVLYIVGSMLGNSPLMAQSAYVDPEQISRMSLMDPFGLVSFIEQARFWTLDEKNSQLIDIGGSLLMNRLIWFSFSLFLLGFAIRGFSMVLKQSPKKNDETELKSNKAVSVRSFAVNPHGLHYHWQTFKAQFTVFLRQSIRSYPVLALILCWTFVCSVEIIQRSMSGEMGIPRWPVLELTLPPLILTIQRLGGLIVIFFVSEWIGLTKKARIWEIHDSLPLANLNHVLCVFSCMGLLVGLLVGTPVLIGWVFQGTQFTWELNSVFLFHYLLRTAIPLLSVGALAILIQWRLPRAVGLGLSFVVIIAFSGVIAENNFFEYPLFRLGYLPEFEFSLLANMNYFEGATNSLALIWGSLIVVFGVLVWKLTKRKAERVPIWLEGLCLSLVGLTFWSSHSQYQQHGWLPRTLRFDQYLAYEKSVEPFQSQNLPDVTHALAEVDLWGEARQLEMTGTLTLTNHHPQPMTSFLVSFSDECDFAELDGDSLQFERILEGLFLVKLLEPMQSGEQTKLNFHIRSKQSSFESLNSENYVLPGASYVELDKLMPQMGAMNSRKLGNQRERRRRGLDPLQIWPEPIAGVIKDNRLVYDVTIRTASNQTAVSLGNLVETNVGERSSFRFVTGSIPDGFAVSSAVYKELRTKTDSGVPVSFYVVDGHDLRAKDMLERAVQSLDVFSNAFGPFPYEQLRLAEIPSFSDRFGGTSYPTCIFLVENRVFTLTPAENQHNLALRGIGHEVSHQWWGGHVQPYFASGYRMMTEVLAMYSETLVGDQSAKDHFLDLVCDKYFFYRGFDEEVPLSEIEDQSFAYYFKGAYVMAALKDLVGEQAINQILKSFADNYAMPNRPVAHDLLGLFYQSFPDQRAWLHEWFETVTTYDLRVLKAHLKPSNEGFELTIQIQASQFDSKGTKVPQKPIELAGFQNGRRVFQKELVLAEEKSWLTFQVPEELDQVVLDPNRYLIDSNFHDQKRQLQLSR